MHTMAMFKPENFKRTWLHLLHEPQRQLLPRIARYKKPQYVEFVPEMPLLKDGTPDRAAVKQRYSGN